MPDSRFPAHIGIEEKPGFQPIPLLAPSLHCLGDVMSMETSIDPRIRPRLADLAPKLPREGREPPRAGSAAEAAVAGGRKAFAHARTGGTDEVTTLGPDREAKTVEAALRFGDLVDLLNPLQHIPIASSLYRTVTGDEISPAARILGAMIYTGPLGFVYATADSLFAEISGKPLGDTLISGLFGGEETGPEAAPDLVEGDAPDAPPAKPAEAPADDRAGNETLTGNEALRALAADLQLFAQSGHRTAAPAEPVQSAAPGPAPASQFGSGTIRDAAASNRSPQHKEAFSQKMAEALDKYRTMAEARRLEEERRHEPSSAPGQIR